MKKHTLGRAAGFVAAIGATAALVAGGVSMTGAYFQDTESGTMSATTGEVDVTVAGSTPLTQSFDNLMPGQPGDSNSYTVNNKGTGPVDLYLASTDWNASDAGWELKPGATISDGVITLDNTDAAVTPLGTSWESTGLSLDLADGGAISFQYRIVSGANCGGGQPRMFVVIDGVQTNTFNGNPGACGTAPDGNGWRTVTLNVPNGGTVTHAGVVFDNPSDRGVAQFRNVSIGAQAIQSDFNLCHADNQDLLIRVQAPGVDTGNLNACNLPAGPIKVASNVAQNASATATVTMSLASTAGNEWANKYGTADLIVIATQAGAAPAPMADQATNDA